MPQYTVKVTQETIVEIDAATEQEALDIAYKTYQEHAAESINAEII